jgi:hypothetical protein
MMTVTCGDVVIAETPNQKRRAQKSKKRGKQKAGSAFSPTESGRASLLNRAMRVS